MPNPKGKCVYHLVIDQEQKKIFDQKYPQLLKTFLERAVRLANNNKDFFANVFFSEGV